ncbi:HAMP domain-containing sensor histidine kinase [soil metagenome]
MDLSAPDLARTTLDTSDIPGMPVDAGLLADLRDVANLDIVSSLLKVICETTGMGFAAVARVTANSWIALAVEDQIEFGLKPGGELELNTTLCKEVRESGLAIVIGHASADDQYRHHHTPRLYNIESYISVPILLSDGAYFGNLCAIDPKPADIEQPRIVSLFTLFARLIALQLENDRRRVVAEAAMLDERTAGELREQFIAILGHDLRNPLQGVTAGAQLIQRKTDDPELIGIASRIRSSARRMSALIDDVLDFARGRLGGGFGVKVDEVGDLDRAFEDVVDELTSAHPERSINVVIRVDGPVRCDRSRLQQLASNLLANAIAHGSSSSPIEFEAVIRDGELTIAVANDGEPIPAENLHQVFAPFWRHSTSRAREGLGLGLFICAQIVKAHDGRFDVTSSSQAGTRFVARIPLGQVR